MDLLYLGRGQPSSGKEGGICLKQPYILAVSGVKNSGKTTLITKLLPLLGKQGIKTAVIKHDGHEFEADVPGTDTYRQLQAGAYATAVFSAGKYMLVKQKPGVSEKELMGFFPEADLILLEGFKGSAYPKIEVIRKENSKESVCCQEGLLAIATDLSPDERNLIEKKDQVLVFSLDDPEKIAEFIHQILL